MRSAIISEGVVTNVIMGEAEGAVPCMDEVGIGWSYDGEDFAPPPVLPVPDIEVSQDAVRAETYRRLSRSDWYIIRAADPTDGTPVPQAVLDERAAIRAASDALRAMDPIPVDFADEVYW